MSFLQQRIWEGTRRADVRVINITNRILKVRRIGLRWPGYPGELQAFPVDVSRGHTLDLHYRLPRPDCAADPGVGAIGVARTRYRTIRRPVDAAGMRFLRRIWGADCTRLRVARVLSIVYEVPKPASTAEIPEGGGPESTMPIGLRLIRRPGSALSPAVTVEAAQGSILFELNLPEPSQGIDVARRSAAIPLVVQPGECNEHSRSQASQPFTFRLWLRMGGSVEPVSVIAPPDKRAQARLLEFLDRACAGRTAH